MTRRWKLTVWLVAVAVICGCGSSPQITSPVSSIPIIVTQPQDATIPMGQTATFSVYAVGALHLSYQWTKNGSAIQGANSSSYTTPAIAFADAGSVFSVIVNSGSASVSSRPAVLNVGPRSPAAGDLRFQHVDVSPMENQWAGETFTYLSYPFGHAYQNVLGSPLQMAGVEGGGCVAGAAHDCGWGFSVVPAPSGVTLSAGYLPDVLENLDADLAYYTDASSVVTSWDMEAGNDVFGMASMKGTATGFDYKHEVVPVSGLQALVANDGANSRVVTAISFDGFGQVHLLSYGWSSDRTSVYDTAIATASYDTVPEQAKSLANGGYIITAFGGNQSDGYLMVGTKVHGDSMPRPVLTFPPSPSGTSVTGYAMVGQAANAQNGGSAVWIFEK